MAIFKGAGVAIVTPMYEDGKVNYDKLEELLEYQIANSTDAIIICGTTGEASTLTHEEHIETIRFAADHVKKRVPVIAGTGSNCTETAVYLSQEAQKAGVRQAAVNQANGKRHLQTTADNSKGEEYIPDDVFAEYKHFFPEWDDKKIIADYKRRHK